MNSKCNVSEKYHTAETNFFQRVECQKLQLLKLPGQGCYRVRPATRKILKFIPTQKGEIEQIKRALKCMTFNF